MTTEEAAGRLGVSTRRVVQLLRQGTLGGEQVHRTWLVSVAAVAERELSGSAHGRPLRPSTARALVDALSAGAGLTTRHARLVRSKTPEELGRLITGTRHVESFATRDIEALVPSLALTGESACERLDDDSAARLTGRAAVIAGYPRGISFDDLVAEALLVPDPTGIVRLHLFEDGIFPWAEAPTALVAADAMRSATARVRDAGREALARMMSGWSERHIS